MIWLRPESGEGAMVAERGYGCGEGSERERRGERARAGGEHCG